MPAIRFIVHTYSSRADANGNRYYYSVIFSTKTNWQLHVNARAARSAVLAARAALGGSIDQFHETGGDTKGKRWVKRQLGGCIRCDEITAADLLALEGER